MPSSRYAAHLEQCVVVKGFCEVIVVDRSREVIVVDRSRALATCSAAKLGDIDCIERGRLNRNLDVERDGCESLEAAGDCMAALGSAKKAKRRRDRCAL